MSSTKEKKSMLNAAQAAEFLGVGESTIRKWVFADTIPYYKLGKYVRFKIEDLEKWMQKNKKGCAA